MKIHEIIQEGDLAKQVPNALRRHSVLTGIEKGADAAHHKLETATVSALMSVPGAVNAISNFSKSRTTASIEALKAVLPWLKNAPKAFDAVNSMLGDSSIAAEFVHLISKVPALAGTSGPALGAMAGAMTPITTLAAPALAAGEYKKKIEADPFNKEFDNNPYAMTVRSAQQGQTTTLSQNAMANRRNAAKNFSTGGNPAQQS